MTASNNHFVAQIIAAVERRGWVLKPSAFERVLTALEGRTFAAYEPFKDAVCSEIERQFASPRRRKGFR